MITIAKGTLPLALFGPRGYGLRSGLLSAPARVLQSASPFLFGLLLNRFGVGAVWWSAGLCLAAFASLFVLAPGPWCYRQPVAGPLTRARQPGAPPPYSAACPMPACASLSTGSKPAGGSTRVKAPVSPDLEMTEIQTRLLAEGGPAALFENVIRSDRRNAIRCRFWSICSAPSSGSPGAWTASPASCARSARRSPF